MSIYLKRLYLLVIAIAMASAAMSALVTKVAKADSYVPNYAANGWEMAWDVFSELSRPQNHGRVNDRFDYCSRAIRTCFHSVAYREVKSDNTEFIWRILLYGVNSGQVVLHQECYENSDETLRTCRTWGTDEVFTQYYDNKTREWSRIQGPGAAVHPDWLNKASDFLLDKGVGQ
jgi:hypothetical protein